MDKHKILAEAKAELERHVWGTFVEGKETVALDGTGVIVSGCEACPKRFGVNTSRIRCCSSGTRISVAFFTLMDILQSFFRLWGGKEKARKIRRS